MQSTSKNVVFFVVHNVTTCLATVTVLQWRQLGREDRWSRFGQTSKQDHTIPGQQWSLGLCCEGSLEMHMIMPQHVMVWLLCVKLRLQKCSLKFSKYTLKASITLNKVTYNCVAMQQW